MRIVLDPGHGGYDPGACSGGLLEKDVNLAIASLAAQTIRRSGMSVTMTRDRDRTMDISQRASAATSSGAGLILSIHANSGPASARGVEAFAAQGDERSMRIARNILHTLAGLYPGLKLRGAKWDTQCARGRLGLLRMTSSKMPSVLLEAGFLTNPRDRRILQDGAFGLAIGEAAVRALVQTIGKPELHSSGFL